MFLSVQALYRKIRLIEGNVKCRHLKKLTCKGTLRQLFICVRPKPPPRPPPPLYTCIQYIYSQREGGRGVSWTREKRRGTTVHKAGSKIRIWLHAGCISSLLSLINTCRKVNLLDDDILLCCLNSYLVHDWDPCISPDSVDREMAVNMWPQFIVRICRPPYPPNCVPFIG